MHTTTTPEVVFESLTDKGLRAAVKYHRLRTEIVMQKIFAENRRIENGETDEDAELLRLHAEYLNHTQLFTHAWRVARQRKITLK